VREIKVTVKTVTPILSGGADGKTPELRVPAFRGTMRYWLRAALGGVIGDSNLDGLHKLESAVFGSPNTGSPISVRLVTQDVEKQKAFILPHKQKGVRYGLVGTFELVLAQPRSSDPIVWNAACVSLSLALTFGGIGLRSRRGYGALRVVKAYGDGIPLFPTTIEGWKSHVERVASTAIQSAQELATAYGVPATGLAAATASYPCATQAGLVRLCNIRAHSAMEAVTQFMDRVPKKNWLGGIKPRQDSPLWVRPIRTGASTYGLLCEVLASDFPGANYRELKHFLDKFSGEYLQVKGWNA